MRQPLTDRELQLLRNMGNECEDAADEIVELRAYVRHIEDSHSAEAAPLAAEVERLRAELISATGQCQIAIEIGAQYAADRQELRAQVESLTADAERLDWFNKNPDRVGWATGYRGSKGGWLWRSASGGYSTDSESLRTAIGSARKDKTT